MGRAGMGVWRAARCVAAAHCEHYTRMRGPMFPRAMHHQLTETITPAPLIRQVQTGNDLYYHNVMQTIQHSQHYIWDMGPAPVIYCLIIPS